MDMMYRVLSIIIAFVIFIVAVIVWLWYRNPQDLITWWNRRIKSECDEQDSSSFNGIPSYYNAWDCPSKTATEFHRLIQLNHNDILAEVNDAMTGNPNTIINAVDNISNKWFKKEDKWNPIWVRFMGDWVNTADKLPTLKRIVSLFPDIPVLHVSIFYPGTTLVEHKGSSRAIHRYHYGLKIPYSDVGLKIAGYDVKWKEKEGFIWDDTLSHSAWNHTSEPRIVIFADIFRELSPINCIGSKAIYSVLQRTGLVSEIKTQLQQKAVI
jgi:hypothetical protein